MIKSWHDALFGLFVVGVSTTYLWQIFTQLDIGDAFNMGSGYVPAIVAALLLLLGLGLLARSVSVVEANAFVDIPWKAVATVCAGMLAFALALDTFGLFPAVLASCLLASQARRMKPTTMLATAVGVGVFCTVIFYFVVGLPVSVIWDWKP